MFSVVPPSLFYLCHTKLTSRIKRDCRSSTSSLCVTGTNIQTLSTYLKVLKNDSDSNISVKVSTRETRSASNGTFLNVGKCRTVNYQNSYYIRAAKVWNTLPSNIKDTTKSLTSFKTLLRKHYKDLTDSVFNPDDPRTLKSVCVKCHTSRPLWTLLSRSCC